MHYDYCNNVLRLLLSLSDSVHPLFCNTMGFTRRYGFTTCLNLV